MLYDIIVYRWRFLVTAIMHRFISGIRYHISPQSLKIKDWNVQCKLNAVLSWNRIGEFWIRGVCCRVMAWFAHLYGCFQQSRVQRRTNPSQQAAYQHDSSICTTNQTAIWGRLPKLHSLLVAYLSISYTECNWMRGLILAPTHAKLCCGSHSISWYCSWNSCLSACVANT